MLHGIGDPYEQLSLPLVNIRASLSQAASRGLLSSSDVNSVIDVARSLYYPERKVSTVLHGCRRLGLPRAALLSTERSLTVDYIDLKRADAREMLVLIRKVLDGSEPRPPRVEFEFNRSSVFESLYNLDRRIGVGDTQISLQSIREYAALHCPEFESVNRAALDRCIVAFFASLLGRRVTSADLAFEQGEFLERRGLNSPDALRDWLRTNGMSETDLSEYLTEEALCRQLRRWITFTRGMDRGCRAVLDEARRRDVFANWAKEAAEEETIVSAYGALPEYDSLREEDPRRLAALHSANSNVFVKGDARTWAEDAGFDDVLDLIGALRRSAIYYDVKARIARLIGALDRVAESDHDAR